MKRHILPYFTILLLCLCCSSQLWAQGRSIPTSSKVKKQQQQEIEATEETPLPEGQKYRYPMLNGLSISVNLFDPLLKAFNTDHANYEALATLDLYHRFMPQVAIGIGSGNDVNDYGLSYKVTSAPYIKVGMAYNFNYNQQIRPDDWYGVFFRYGCSSSSADIKGMSYVDGYWEEYGPAEVLNQTYKCHWIELGACLRVKVYKRFYMGWDVYVRPLLRKAGNEYGDPYFIPGYGVTSSLIGFQFHLQYAIF